RRGIREDAPQRRVFAGRETGCSLESELAERTEVQGPRCARRDSGTGFQPVNGRDARSTPRSVVPAADVHECERRSGAGGGEFLSVAAETFAGGGGRCGGHHGLESVEQHLATQAFARLRLGIGRKDSAREITDYVLDRFDAAEA